MHRYNHARWSILLAELEGDLQDVLEFSRISPESADKSNIDIAQKCLEYIEQVVKEDSEFELPNRWDVAELKPEPLVRFPLLSYSVLHWHDHVRCIESLESNKFNLLPPFYAKKSLGISLWLRLYWSATEDGELLAHFSPMHIAC